MVASTQPSHNLTLMAVNGRRSKMKFPGVEAVPFLSGRTGSVSYKREGRQLQAQEVGLVAASPR